MPVCPLSDNTMYTDQKNTVFGWQLQLTFDFTNDIALLYDTTFIKFKEDRHLKIFFVKYLHLLHCFLERDNAIFLLSKQLNHIMIYKQNQIISGEPDVISVSDFITFNNKEIFPISEEYSKKTFDYDIECYTYLPCQCRSVNHNYRFLL